MASKLLMTTLSIHTTREAIVMLIVWLAKLSCATATAPIVLPCMGACSVVCIFPNQACRNFRNGCLALTHKCMKECEGL